MQPQHNLLFGALLPALVSLFNFTCAGKDATLIVKVVDDIKNVGIENAAVQLKDSTGHEVSDVTDHAGQFTATKLSHGKATVLVKKVHYAKYPTTKTPTLEAGTTPLEIRLIWVEGDDGYYVELGKRIAQDLNREEPDYNRWKVCEESPALSPSRKVKIAAEIAKRTPPKKLVGSTIPTYAQLAPDNLLKTQHLFEAAIQRGEPVPGPGTIDAMYIPKSAVIGIVAAGIGRASTERKKDFLKDFEKKWGTETANSVRGLAGTMAEPPPL